MAAAEQSSSGEGADESTDQPADQDGEKESSQEGQDESQSVDNNNSFGGADAAVKDAATG